MHCRNFSRIIGGILYVYLFGQIVRSHTILKGIGEARAKQFANLNIVTLEDLICHFPRAYEDRTQILPIEKLQADVPACFRAMVMNTPRTSHIRKGLDLTKVTVADTTGRLNLTFFNSPYAAQQLQYGRSTSSTGRSPGTSSATR